MDDDGFYRRHSAFRTINGGICCGLTVREPGFTQLLLLGYHRTANSLGFKNNFCFFNLLNVISRFPLTSAIVTAPSPYRPIQVSTLLYYSQIIRLFYGCRIRSIALVLTLVYLIRLQLVGWRSSSSISIRLMSQFLSGCFRKESLALTRRNDL